LQKRLISASGSEGSGGKQQIGSQEPVADFQRLGRRNKCKFVHAALNPEVEAYASVPRLSEFIRQVKTEPVADWVGPQGLKQRATDSKDTDLKGSEIYEEASEQVRVEPGEVKLILRN
jgi:hypothetical protein